MSETVTAEVKTALAYGARPPVSIPEFIPDDPEDFGFTAQIFIGEVGDDAVDSFDITVCSPSWFASQVAAGEWTRFGSAPLTTMPVSVSIGASMWFMRRWDASEVMAAVAAVCEAFSPAPDWGTLASRIGRVIPWEFNYRYDEHLDRRYGEPFPPRR